MPYRIPTYCAEAFSCFTAMITTLVSPLLFASVGDNQAAFTQMQVFLFPLIGALFACLVSFLLNPKVEIRRVVVGRAVAAFFVGTGLPQFVGTFHPVLNTQVPAVLAFIGAGGAMVVFILSASTLREAYKRADKNADKINDAFENRVLTPLQGDLRENTRATRENTQLRAASVKAVEDNTHALVDRVRQESGELPKAPSPVTVENTQPIAVAVSDSQRINLP